MGRVVGHGRIMRAHHAGRVAEARAVLDHQPVQRVGVVAGPDLGGIVQHAAVEPRAAARAVFQQQVGVAVGQALLQLVHAQHIAVVHLALAGGGQRRAVHVGQRAVHIPLDIGDRAGIQQRRQLPPDALAHIGAGEIERILVAQRQRFAPRDLQRPVRVGAVEVAVRVDGFRLHPEAERKAKVVDLAAQTVDPLGQLGRVGHPVAQAACVVVAALEPAVVQHEQVATGRFGRGGQAQQFGLVKIEIAGFPAVEQDGARRGHVRPAGGQQMPPDGAVEAPAHRPETRAAVDERGLGGNEPPAGCERPGKAERLNAHRKPHARGRGFGLHAVVAAVHKRRAPAFAAVLAGIGRAEHDERVVRMGGDAAHAAHRLHAGAHGGAAGRALGRPGAVERDKVERRVRAAGKIQHGRRHAAQGDGLLAGVFKDGRAGDDIAPGQHAVEQRQRQAAAVLERDAQRLGAGVLPNAEGGQPRQRVLARAGLDPGKAHLGGDGAVGPFRRKKRRVVVPQAGAGPFLRQAVGAAAGVEIGLRPRGRGLAQRAVIQVQQPPGLVHAHPVARVGGVQRKQPGARVCVDHGRGSFFAKKQRSLSSGRAPANLPGPTISARRRGVNSCLYDLADLPNFDRALATVCFIPGQMRGRAHLWQLVALWLRPYRLPVTRRIYRKQERQIISCFQSGRQERSS